MKKTLCLITLFTSFILILNSCKKKTDDPKPSSGYTQESVQGTWETDEVQFKMFWDNVIQQDTTYDYTSGQFTLKFEGNKLFRLYDNGSYTDTLTIQVENTSLIQMFPGGDRDTFALDINGSNMSLTKITEYDACGKKVREEETTRTVKK